MDAGRPLSGIRAKLYEVMVAQPKYWEPYYGGTEAQHALARKYSFSDRVRYCWPDPIVEASFRILVEVGRIGPTARFPATVHSAGRSRYKDRFGLEDGGKGFRRKFGSSSGERWIQG